MSKTLILGDIHGRTVWKDMAHQDFDKVVFLGDYCTTHDHITSKGQISNLEEILTFKEDNPDKVILLRGNHDTQMLGYSWAECSPTDVVVQAYMSKPDFKEYFLNNTQWVYIEDKVLFSHAGVSKVWLKDIAHLNSVDKINNLPPSEIFGFTPDNYFDVYGTSKTQPPTWIRPSTLYTCGVDGYTQVIGHTPVEHINKVGNIWLCDALGVHEYLTLEDGKFMQVKL